MLHNYLKVAVRHLIRDRAHTILNVAGLSIGIAGCLVIGLYVTHELSYDRHYPNVEHIYRVNMEWQFRETGLTSRYASTSPVFAARIREDTPEVVEVARFLGGGDSITPVTIQTNVKAIPEKRSAICDAEFLTLFGFPFVEGDPVNALASAASIVMTESAARRYFGSERALNQTLVAHGSSFQVTGVMVDLPSNSQFDFDILFPLDAFPWLKNRDTWGNMAGHTFVRLDPEADPVQVDARIRTIADRLAPGQQDRVGVTYRYHLQPVTDIRLYSDLLNDRGNGDIRYVYLFSTIGILILAIASINFVNLTIARFSRRIQEVGLRKVVGARRVDLFVQFLGESLLLVALSYVIGLGIVEIVLPYSHDWLGNVWEIGDRLLILLGLGTVVGVAGLLAGAYPAYRAATSVAVEILKGDATLDGRPSRFRHGLIVFQLSTSAILIIASSVIYAQIEFMQSRNLGFERDQILCLGLGWTTEDSDLSALKTQLMQRADVKTVSATWSVPGRHMMDIKAHVQRGGGEATETFQYIRADANFVDLLGVPLLAGRYFTASEDLDSKVSVVNEAALPVLGVEDPADAIGIKIGRAEVVGVIRDFNYKSLHHPVEPLLIDPEPNPGFFLAVKLRTTDMKRSIDDIREVWETVVPAKAFDFFFVDEYFDGQYRFETKLGGLFSVFSALAASIAAIGLFGLASIAAQLRLKEVGIRKVLGASFAQVWTLISSDFLKLILVSVAVSIPLAYVLLNRWLETFSVHTTVRASDFIFTFGLLGLVGILTISYHVTRAALSDPSEVLRKE